MIELGKSGTRNVVQTKWVMSKKSVVVEVIKLTAINTDFNGIKDAVDLVVSSLNEKN